jgi:Cu2+-exporting ATPase
MRHDDHASTGSATDHAVPEPVEGHQGHHHHAVPESVEGHHGHEHHASTGSATGHEHHGDHSHHDPAQFRRKFWLSLILTIPTLLFSTGLQEILGLDGPRFAGSEFIPAVFAIAIFFYGGLVFLRGGIQELRARQPGMMTLISLAIVVALAYSLAVTLGFPGMDFWWELATLITIMLLGHWVEMSAIMGAQNALGELAKLIPDEADLLHGDPHDGGHVMPVPVATLNVGDRVLVRPGAAVPVDGEVVEGVSEVNESLLTGESVPVRKAPASDVIAGSINGSGALTVRVTKTGDDTAIAGVMKLVADAQASKSGAQVLADRAAALLFYVALGAAILTLVAWSLISPDDPAFVVERVVTVLIIACPHALGLAIPLVAQLSTAIGARKGLLVRSRAALEDARNIQVVLFDKTGTLTAGRQGVARVVPVGAASDDELLALAASVESDSEHPIARAIVAAAADRGVTAGHRIRVARRPRGDGDGERPPRDGREPPGRDRAGARARAGPRGGCGRGGDGGHDRGPRHG